MPLTPVQTEVYRKILLSDQLLFTQYMFKARDHNPFLVSPHHVVMASTLDRVFTGEITRLIINVPPGYTKTEFILAFIARGFAINPESKFIMASYSKPLVLQNSMLVKDTVSLPEYTELFPLAFRKDAKAKGQWNTDQGGAFLAAAAGSSITGFRAGRLYEGFSGAFLIDDPLKPEDAHSEPIRTRINRRVTSTFKSRIAHEKVPIILIMQRLHEDDMTAHLLKGATGEKWHHLVIPVEVEYPLPAYRKEYTHGIPVEHGLEEGPIWPAKHTAEDIQRLKSDSYTFSGQYMQDPVPPGGAMFKDEYWKYYDPEAQGKRFEYRFITVDTAQKTKEHNDYSVFACWGYLEGNLYLLDLIRGKWESPDLRQEALAFVAKHHHRHATYGVCRYMKVEDKVAGTDLIQNLQKTSSVPIEAVQRNVDKYTRAKDALPYVKAGRVYLPEGAPFLTDFKLECRSFTPLMTHKHDDQVDVLLDAIEDTFYPTCGLAGTIFTLEEQYGLLRL